MAEVSCRIFVRGTAGLIKESQLPEDMRAGFEQLNEWERIKANMPYSVITSEDEAPGPPVIVQNPEEEVTEVGEGQTAKFMCRVGGSPAPAVFWYRNEQLIKQSNRMKVWYDGIHRLEILKVKPTDSGLITLIARNHYGEARFDTNLVVKTKWGTQNRSSNKTESVVMKKFVSNSVTTTVNTTSLQVSNGSSPNGHLQTGVQL
ncbi:myosin light chain kinase, smooth muscle-like [Symsagittifera roscoffensis]|uniref:myosin light chain kinase, smooth muscle-like n=1 Tax=Symsagittifera roscoffensis TaxID=84072 RepID=UPI00307BCF1F